MSSYVSVANAIKEFEHWLRLTCFLHDPIKNALLQVLHNKLKDPSYQGIPDNPVALYQFFLNNKNTLNQLVKKKLLKKEQLDLLLPQGGNQTFSSEFDVTLITLLIQYFTTLQPKKGWKTKNPSLTDTSLAAFVIRAREWRNFINHIDAKIIDLLLFQQKWQEGCDIVNGLHYQYNTKFLETMPLDPKHHLVLKALKSCLEKLKSNQKALSKGIQTLQSDVKDVQNEVSSIKNDISTKVTEIETNIESQDQSITDINNDIAHTKDEIDGRFDEIASQIETISQAVELHNTLNPKKSNSGKVDYCLTVVSQYVSSEIGDQKDKLLQRLGKENKKSLSVEESIENVSWLDLKKNLLKVGRHDMVDHIERNTLITEGLYAASKLLKQKTIKKLIDWLVQEPFSPSTSNTCYVPREEQFVNLTILNSKEYENRFSNSDREVLMKQGFKEQEGVTMNELFKANDEIVVARGVGGSGKTSLVGMYNLKWAKAELDTGFQIEFMFTFACRELNKIVDGKTTLEDLFKTCFPEVFELINLDDLKNLGSRVMIIIDGIDELQNIYGIEDKSMTEKPHAQIVRQLIDQNFIPGHKTFICGRPKACQFLRNSLLSARKTKIVDVCGFTEAEIYGYIGMFFEEKEKSDRLIKQLQESDNLRQMCAIPVFLWIVCHIFNEEIIPGNLETITEIYFYSWLVFLRNHFRIEDSSECLDFYSIVNSQNILRSIFTLMKLSTKLYMDNKVIFTAKEVEGVQSEFDLEKTGFITKFEGGALKEPTYQFAHLVFQEFFTGVYLWITKSTSKYSSNRELTSCLPTVLGIQRMLNNKENELFIGFIYNLERIYQEIPRTTIAKTRKLYKSIQFKNNIAKRMELPKCMVKKQTVIIDMRETKCTDFLASYFEARFEVKNLHRFKNFQIKGFNDNRLDSRNAHFFVVQHNLLAKLPLSCQVVNSLLKVKDENHSDFNNWLQFLYEGQHLIDKSKLPQNVAIDDSYPVNNESYSFLGSLYFLTQITRIKFTELPAECVLNGTLLVGRLVILSENLKKFCDIVQKENLELPRLNLCLIDIKGVLSFDMEKLIFILQRTNIKTIEIPENYVEVQETENTETFVLKDTAQHCSSFIERLEAEEFTVIRKGLSIDQVAVSTWEKLEEINCLLQSSNTGTFQFPVSSCHSFDTLSIFCDDPIWSLKLNYFDYYQIDCREVSKAVIYVKGDVNYKNVDLLLDEMKIPVVDISFEYFEGMENNVGFITLFERIVGNAGEIFIRFEEKQDEEFPYQVRCYNDGSINLDYLDCHDANKFVECYKTLCEHFPLKELFLDITDVDTKVPERLEIAQRFLTHSIDRKLKINVSCGDDGRKFLTDNQFDTYENLTLIEI
ncbi:uncharacterized protein [Clytia hemisphaerica]|uniref:NACHT domain-containing protein n=1 Tax=Clytia hemisphaerica TaxID=252671 RepID=A0A7M5WTS8_9CNID